MRTLQPLDRFLRSVERDPRLDQVTRRLDPVASSVATSSAGPALRGEWLGHALHPALTDIPIGFWTSSFVLDFLGGKRARPASQRLIGLGLAAVPVTALAGMADYESMNDTRSRRVGALHAAGNIVVAGLYFASWRQRRRGHHLRGVAYGIAGGGLATVTAYLGGALSFGSSDTPDGGSDKPASTTIGNVATYNVRGAIDPTDGSDSPVPGEVGDLSEMLLGSNDAAMRLSDDPRA